MLEDGVGFNADSNLPREYLMRRSYNTNDTQIPGAVVREWRCKSCGHIMSYDPFRNLTTYHQGVVPICPEHDMIAGFSMGPRMVPHAVDVPLVKIDGSRWQ